MNPTSILTVFQRSGRILLSNLDGLSPAQAFWTPASNVNSINWLVGHLISARTSALIGVGQAKMWDDETRAHYRGGSAPITGEGEGVLDLMRLLFDFAESQRRLEAGLTAMSSEALDAPAESPERFASVADHLLYLNGHEMHHIGQLMVIRELLGFASHWS